MKRSIATSSALIIIMKMRLTIDGESLMSKIFIAISYNNTIIITKTGSVIATSALIIIMKMRLTIDGESLMSKKSIAISYNNTIIITKTGSATLVVL